MAGTLNDRMPDFLKVCPVYYKLLCLLGQIDFFDATFESETIFGGCGALIFVIDAQDDYNEVGNVCLIFIQGMWVTLSASMNTLDICIAHRFHNLVRNKMVEMQHHPVSIHD